MELRQIIQFVAVAEARNFRQAAAHLHMSQPPLSQAIRRLETELAVRLFHRTSRSVELTEAGKVLLTEARRILADIDAAVLMTQRTAHGDAGKLSVGFTVPWAYEVMPRILQEFRAARPNVALSLRETSSSAQLRNLLDGGLDVGFLRLPGKCDIRGIATIPLHEDRLAVVLPAAHPLGTMPSLALTDLQDEAFILPPFQADAETEPFSFRMQVVRLCLEAGYSPRVAQEAIQMQTIVRLVETGLGISLIPMWTTKHFSSGAVYRDLDCSSDLARLTLAAAWNPDNRSPALDRFLDVVRNAPLTRMAASAI